MSELSEKTSELEERLAELEAFFDVEGLREEAAELGEQMSRPGFWDDQERARELSARFSRVQGRIGLLEGLRGASRTPRSCSSSRTRTVTSLRGRGGAAAGRAGARGAGGGAALHRRVRRGGCHPHHKLRRRRGGLAGLGRDARPHVPALGRAQGLRARGHRVHRGRGGRHKERHLHRLGRVRLRATFCRARGPQAGEDQPFRRKFAGDTPASPRSPSRPS